MKRYFSIEWVDDLGEMWMNDYNLISCLLTAEHCGDRTLINVLDVTDQFPPNLKTYKDNTIDNKQPIKGRKLLLL